MGMFNQITDHVWYMQHSDETDRPALGYIHCGKSSLMVDSGNSPDHISLFYGNVRSIGFPDPEFIVITHWHWDHVFGLSGSPAKSIAHVITNEKLQNMQRWDWSDSSLNSRVAAGLEIPFCAEMIKKEMPGRHSFKVKSADISFMEKCCVRLEDITCQIVHVGGPHSEDSVVVFVPQEKVLFVADCYMENLYAGGGSLRLDELKRLIAVLEQFDAEWIVPGHTDPMKRKEFFSILHEMENIGEMIEGAADPASAEEKLTGKLNRKLTSDEKEYAAAFANGNRFSFLRMTK